MRDCSRKPATRSKLNRQQGDAAGFHLGDDLIGDLMTEIRAVACACLGRHTEGAATGRRKSLSRSQPAVEPDATLLALGIPID
jgi:hypothetical protein